MVEMTTAAAADVAHLKLSLVLQISLFLTTTLKYFPKHFTIISFFQVLLALFYSYHEHNQVVFFLPIVSLYMAYQIYLYSQILLTNFELVISTSSDRLSYPKVFFDHFEERFSFLVC